MQPFRSLRGIIIRREVLRMHNKSLRTDDYIDEVLKKHSNMVFRIAYSQTKNKADAEDVFQNVFVRLMCCGTEFENEKHLEAWLIRVTVNCSKNVLTSAWFRKTTKLEDTIAVDAPQTSDIYNTVMQLPSKYRIVIHLHYYEDKPIAEIASVLGKNENTVKSQLHRAREILKQKLKGEFDYV